ncbi:MAG TPA: hypothetical protein DHW14_05085 [Clostridiales bacterium]|nr:hypothetical protein [Clostridiales bacterium]
MSVISSYRTRIRLSPERLVGGEVDPTWRLMEEAVQAAADELGGRVTDRITDYYGRVTVCDFAVVTPEFPRGVGVRVEPSGEVVFIYDHYGGYQRVGAEIRERIAQNYAALAVARALEQMNYSVEIDEAGGGRGETRAVVVRGTL